MNCFLTYRLIGNMLVFAFSTGGGELTNGTWVSASFVPPFIPALSWAAPLSAQTGGAGFMEIEGGTGQIVVTITGGGGQYVGIMTVPID